MKNRLRALLLILILVCLVFAAGLVNARIVRLKRLEVSVDSLDIRLDGMRVLFMSDLKIRDSADARRCATLVRKLCASKPQLLVIGGDLTASSCSDEALKVFFEKTKDVRLECGMYIVYGDSDILIPDAFLNASPFELISGGQKKCWYNGAPFVVAGYDGMVKNNRSFMFTDEGTGLCIVAAHNPEMSKLLPYRADSAGVPYCDLFLCGHTLGGQINIAGYPLLYSDLAKEYSDELMYRLTIPVVVSRGTGTEYLPLRAGSEPAAYMITLTKEALM